MKAAVRPSGDNVYEASPGIGSGVSCLTPEPFARAIINKSAPGMSGAWRRKRRRVPSCDQIGSLSIVRSTDRRRWSRPSADRRSGCRRRGEGHQTVAGRAGQWRQLVSSAGEDEARRERADEQDAEGRWRARAAEPRRAVERSRASGATFRGWSRPTAGSYVRSARRGRRSSRGSAARRAPRASTGSRVRSVRSASCELPSGDGARRVDHRVSRDRGAHRAERSMETGLGGPERDAQACSPPRAAASRGSSA